MSENFVPGMVAVGADPTRGLGQAVGAAGEFLQTGPPEQGDLIQHFGEAVTAHLNEMGSLLKVDDPIRAARSLHELPSPINASPIHQLAIAWHSVMGSKGPTPDGAIEVTLDEPGDGVIGVVDTGVSDSLPPWMSGAVDGDPETAGVGASSHGTFVASILRRLAPDFRIQVASAVSPSDHQGPTFTSTEGHISLAIDTLIANIPADKARALNISMGGPSVAGRTDYAMTLLSGALDRWRTAFPNAPVFAAAGNSMDVDPIYPAAFSCARGVAAAAKDNPVRQVVWEDTPPHAEIDAALYRHWVDDVARGSDIRGFDASDGNDSVVWSGSSFATAVAVGMFLSNGPHFENNGIRVWEDTGSLDPTPSS